MGDKPKRINQAKSLVARPMFRSRQEKPKKGKGSYQRKASPHREAFFMGCLQGTFNSRRLPDFLFSFLPG